MFQEKKKKKLIDNALSSNEILRIRSKFRASVQFLISRVKKGEVIMKRLTVR